MFLTLLGLYLLTASFRIDTPDTRIRLQVARNLARRGTPSIEPLQLRTEFGIVGAFPGRDGRPYSIYGLGQSALMVPLVLAAGDLDGEAVMLLNLIATLFTCVLLRRLGRALEFSAVASTRLALLVGVCTLAWPHAKLSFEAPLETLCLVGALTLLTGAPRVRAAAAGLAIGAAILTRPTAVVMLPGLLWLAARAGREGGRGLAGSAFRSTATLLLGAAPMIALALAYNALRWGGPLASGYTRTDYSYFQLSWEGYFGLMFSPGKGFFWYSPVLLLAPWGWRRLRARHADLAWTIAILAACYLVFFGSSTVWHGDWTWGPRHLLPLVPVVALCLLPLLEPGRLARRVWIPILSVSLLVQLIGISVPYYHAMAHMDLHRRPGAIPAAYHFRPGDSQIVAQARAGRDALSGWPAALRAHDAATEPGPYLDLFVAMPQPHLRPRPPILDRLPASWMLYAVASGAPVPVVVLGAAACAALLAAGLLGLRGQVWPRGPPAQ